MADALLQLLVCVLTICYFLINLRGVCIHTKSEVGCTVSQRCAFTGPSLQVSNVLVHAIQCGLQVFSTQVDLLRFQGFYIGDIVVIGIIVSASRIVAIRIPGTQSADFDTACPSVTHVRGLDDKITVFIHQHLYMLVFFLQFHAGFDVITITDAQSLSDFVFAQSCAIRFQQLPLQTAFYVRFCSFIQAQIPLYIRTDIQNDLRGVFDIKPIRGFHTSAGADFQRRSPAGRDTTQCGISASNVNFCFIRHIQRRSTAGVEL